MNIVKEIYISVPNDALYAREEGVHHVNVVNSQGKSNEYQFSVGLKSLNYKNDSKSPFNTHVMLSF